MSSVPLKRRKCRTRVGIDVPTPESSLSKLRPRGRPGKMSDFAARFVRNAVNRWFSRVVVFTDLRYRSRTLIRIKLCTNLARSGNSIRWYYSARARVCVRDYNLIVPTIIETPRTCLNVLFIYIYKYA